jgi:16S rRNA (cytosine967-C5)-methyltransferase
LRVLERVERSGAYADLALHSALTRSDLAASDRALTTDLVCGTLRWRGRLDFLLAHVLERDPAKLEPRVAQLLQLGAYQLTIADRIHPAAAVDQTVRTARAAGLERAAGLVNAVLRRLAREHSEIALPSLESDPLGHLTHALSLPAWLAERWLESWGAEAAAALARASNEVPPLTVRVNPLRAEREPLLAALREHFPEARACRFAPEGIVLGRGGNPGREPAFLEGRFTVQDEASQLVAVLLGARAGERILDLCAAPGTKTTAIAERLGEAGEVVAADRNPRRLALVGRDARRLGLANVTTREIDGTGPLASLAGPRPFDRVLVDAPCSGLGTLRRNPDARWRVRRSDLPRLAEIQHALLCNAASVLRPGGTLVYSTCTLTKEENEAVVDAFLGEAKDFRRKPPAALPEGLLPLVAEDGFLRSLPHVHGTDGFFAAALERAT